MKLASIDLKQRLYVMHEGKGYSCYGWDVLDRKAKAVAQWANLAGTNTTPGTTEHFEYCAQVMDAGAAYARETGKRCDAELTPQLIGLEGKRVEVVEADGERRRFIVGKSMGWMPVHLEIKTRRSSGGGAVYGAPFKSVRRIN